MRRWWVRLLRYAPRFWRGLLLLLGLVVADVGLQTLRPWPVKLAIDRLLDSRASSGGWLPAWLGTHDAFGLLMWLTVGFVMIVILQHVSAMAQAWLRTWVGARISYALASDVFARLLGSSASWRAGHRVGDLVSRVNSDCTCVRDLLVNVGIAVLQCLMTLVAIFVIMWQLDWVLALVALAVAVPMGASIVIFAGPMTERSYEQAQQQGKLMADAEQALGVVPAIQAFGREQEEDRRFRQTSDHTVRATMRAIAAQLRFRLSVNGASALGMATMLLAGGYRALAGHISVGDLYVFLSYLASLYSPLETLAYLSSGVATAKGKARRVFDVLDGENELAQPLAPKDLDAAKGKPLPIRFEGVSFAYRPGRNVLEQVDLTIAAGEHVALVGATGAGKSTLTRLILRFVDPTQGLVRVGGVDLRDLSTRTVREHVAWVPQEPMLLPRTVAENIALGRPAASRDEIVAAARAARIAEFIEQLPHGYDTMVGERGATLSGGQAQRLAIARALLRDAPIVVLDEPTSALDAETERRLVDAVVQLTRGRTTVTIAHRLSTIRHADRIIVLDRGCVVETGPHDELLARGGLYAEFCQADMYMEGGQAAEASQPAERPWTDRVTEARQQIERCIPTQAAMILVDQDQLAGTDVATVRKHWPFTEVDGMYNGPPLNSDAAIAELERLRRGGAGYIVFAWPSFWWLQHYADFEEYLDTHGMRLMQTEDVVIFRLKDAAD